ncbi:MAG: beta-galactosidase trimerization domain-containing protein [Planctomycetota bacterium]|jgi:hypothetical protein
MDRQVRVVAGLLLLCAIAGAQDAYEKYVRKAPEFTPVRKVEPKAWATWYYMPWRYRWKVGTGDEGGRFCEQHGINGGYIDHGEGPIGWMEKYKLRFYVDHVAGKGTLHLRKAKNSSHWKPVRADANALRPVMLDQRSLDAARKVVKRNLRKVSKSGMRVAYALDDEVSWGVFAGPMCWRIHDRDKAYRNWLKTYRGKGVKARFVTPEFVRAQLKGSLATLDFSPFLDRMTYNDSVFANFLGELVETANAVDRATPTGFVGGQSPSLWGGYDYAKLTKKTQFLEVYDIGSAPEIVRSLTDAPLVSTHFRKPGRDAWFAWKHFAHGQRGLIAWVDNAWWDEKWLAELAVTLKELGGVQGPKLKDARLQDDGIALYYSHPSIQVSWCLDAQCHGKTWPNRLSDALLGTSHTVRKAWETMLNDAGLQYRFVAYDDVIREGVPKSCRVLILPACYALSDAEAKRIRAFAARGGTVIADFMCGLFDPYGRGRKGGALDDLFGVEHTGEETAKDFFAERLWVETDQDAGYGAATWRKLAGTLGVKLRDGYAVAERQLEGPVRKGKAVYLNLSPLRYLVLREEGRANARAREPFLKWLPVKPAVTATGDSHLELLRWQRKDRKLLFVVQSPVLTRGAAGAIDGSKKSYDVRRGETKIVLRFKRMARELRDERTGKGYGSGTRFTLPFVRDQAVFVSYR